MTTLPMITLWQPWATLIATQAPCTKCSGHGGFAPDGIAGGWSTCRACGGTSPMVKRWETRSWPCPPKYIGQRIAIHAAKRTPDACPGDLYSTCTDGTGFYWLSPRTDAGIIRILPRGAVVATAVITASLPIHAYDDWSHDGEASVEVRRDGTLWHYPTADGVDDESDISDQLPYGDWTPGRWAWQLDDVRALAEPIPWRGKQGWFQVEVPE